MKKSPRYCNKCKRVIFYFVPKMRDEQIKRQWVGRNGKYWCKECWERHEVNERRL